MGKPQLKDEIMYTLYKPYRVLEEYFISKWLLKHKIDITNKIGNTNFYGKNKVYYNSCLIDLIYDIKN